MNLSVKSNCYSFNFMSVSLSLRYKFSITIRDKNQLVCITLGVYPTNSCPTIIYCPFRQEIPSLESVSSLSCIHCFSTTVSVIFSVENFGLVSSS